MKNNKKIIGTAALVAVITSIGLAGVSFAYRGDPNIQGPNYTPERHEAMTKAIENLDYDQWKKLHEENGRGQGIVNRITKENFAKFKEMHNLQLKGKIEEANKIRTELGLGQGIRMHGQGKGQGQGFGKRGMNRGTNAGGNFIDTNGDGICDNLK